MGLNEYYSFAALLFLEAGIISYNIQCDTTYETRTAAIYKGNCDDLPQFPIIGLLKSQTGVL
jgi:hypothetical protein